MKTRSFQDEKQTQSIFVVEDNEDIGFILEFFLHEEGFQVKLLTTAAAFRNAMETELPDLILLDVMLPDGNGLDLCQGIKRDHRVKQLPVMIMSAHADGARVKACNAEEFIAKPFDLYALLKKIKTHLPAA